MPSQGGESRRLPTKAKQERVQSETLSRSCSAATLRGQRQGLITAIAMAYSGRNYADITAKINSQINLLDEQMGK